MSRSSPYIHTKTAGGRYVRRRFFAISDFAIGGFLFQISDFNYV